MDTMSTYHKIYMMAYHSGSNVCTHEVIFNSGKSLDLIRYFCLGRQSSAAHHRHHSLILGDLIRYSLKTLR